MKKIFFAVFLFSLLKITAQLPPQIDSLRLVYEKLKDDTFKVERFLWIATETSGIDTAVSGQYGRRAYSLALKLNDSKGIGNSFNYFGRRFYQIQKYNDAIKCFERAADYFSKAKYLRGSASALNNVGVIYNEQGNFDKAIEFQKKSLEVNIEAKYEEGVANNYINMGNTCNLKGEYEPAMKWMIKAEAIYSKINSWENLATVYYNMAFVHFNLKQHSKAEEYCLKSLKLREERSHNKIGMAYSNVFLAAIYSDTNFLNLPKAKACYKKVIDLCKETGDRITLLSSYISISKTYSNQNKLDSALINIKNALLLSRELGNQVFEISSLYYQGEIYLKMNHPALALKSYKEGYELSVKIGDKTYICDNANGLGKSYYELKKYKEAYEYLFIYSRNYDILFSENNLKTTSELEAKYQNEKKEFEIKKLNKDKKVQELELSAKEEENATKNKILVLGTIALAGILLFAFFAFKNYKKAQRANLIINSQKNQVELQNEEIVQQKHIVEEKQKEILDSIRYAQKIQSAVLTSESVWNKISSEHFIIFLPKDIVSGDFYWAYNTPNNRSIFALADCTGHGVPGGFMSMLGNSFLNELVVENKIFKADEILNKLRQKIILSLEQKGNKDQKDGMDMAICVWNKINHTVEFSGANNNLWLIRNNSLTQYSGDKMPIGNYSENPKPFSSQIISIEKNDLIILSTDGFADQFGGTDNKKLMSKNLKRLLTDISAKKVEAQKDELLDFLKSWKGNNQQVDDISMIAVKVV